MIRLKTSVMLGAMLWLAGCGGGDTLPLVPVAGTCDRPPDPFWNQLSPLCGNRAQLDAVWSGAGDACVVGTAGLVLRKQGNRPFRLENPGTDAPLFGVTMIPDGTIIAVGAAGTVAERGTGGWATSQVTGAGSLQTIISEGGLAYAVGSAGTVIARDDQGHWRDLDFPGTADLTGVAVRQDTLAVSGSGGALWLLADSRWIDLSVGPWQDQAVHSVTWLDDGRFLAIADEFYLGSPDGWEIPELADWYFLGTGRRVKNAAGHLWVTTDHEVVRINPAGESWTWDYFFSGNNPALAVLDREQFLLTSSEGNITWYRAGERTTDPAGLDQFELFRLGDGTVGARTDDGLLVPGTLGLETVLEFDGQINETMGRPTALAGRSLDELFLARIGQLWRLSGGQLELVADLGDGDFIYDMILDTAGNLHLGSREGLFRWNGAQVERTLEFADNFSGAQFSRTRWGSLVANVGYYIWYLGEAGWVPLDRQPLVVVGEPSPGDLLFINRDDFQLRRPGVGLVDEGSFDPAPVCPGLGYGGGVDSLLGLYVFSSAHSLVFRLNGNPQLGNWDLVAGPLDGEILALEILADGTMLAKAHNNTEALLIHVPR